MRQFCAKQRQIRSWTATLVLAGSEPLSRQSGTNEDASLDAILMLAQKVDGEIQVTQMETGRVDDDAGYGVFQTRMAGQTIVFGIADRRMRETGSGEITSVNFNSVMLRFTEGSVSSSLAASPGETFQIGTYGDAEITSVRLMLGIRATLFLRTFPRPATMRLLR